jgi:hypothetical protein
MSLPAMILYEDCSGPLGNSEVSFVHGMPIQPRVDALFCEIEGRLGLKIDDVRGDLRHFGLEIERCDSDLVLVLPN